MKQQDGLQQAASNECKGMVLTVGGSIEPLVYSIGRHQPHRVLFVVSPGSRDKVENEIVPCCSHVIAADYCELSDENNIEQIYREIQQSLDSWLRTTRLVADEVVVDFTGGTKPMSAGLALAAMERINRFHYVAGKIRDRGGLGVVQSGSETPVIAANPWNVYARRALQEARQMYEASQPREAARLLGRAEELCAPSMQSILRAYRTLLELLAETDNFRFKNLVHQSRRYADLHQAVLFQRESAATYDAWRLLVVHWQEVETELSAKGPTRKTLRELLANAERRAKQQKYDDAIARLYRATEMWVQGLGWEHLGASLGQVQMDGIPEAKRDTFVAAFGEPAENGTYRLPLLRLVEAVAGFGGLSEKDAESLRETYERLASHLAKRNESILAHGNRPATEDDFTAFRDELTAVLGPIAEDLPRWPELRFTE